MKLIDLHKEWCKRGMLPSNGLCFSLPKSYFPKLKSIEPTKDERWRNFETEGYGFSYWAGQANGTSQRLSRGYTPLRQTIVLLICAMNNEL